MHRSLRSAFVTCVVVSLATGAAAQNRSFEAPAARTSQGRGALTLPSTASPRAVLAQYLLGQGRSQATVDSLVESNRNAGRQGVTHAQFEQRAGGVAVYGTYAKASFSADGELISLVENLATVPARVTPARVNAQQAVAAASGESLSGVAHGAGRILPQRADCHARRDSSRRRNDERRVPGRDVDATGQSTE